MDRIYIGFDSRETKAYSVAEKTAQRFGYFPEPLYEDRLRLSGMLTRPKDVRGQQFDLISGAPQSTEFAIARFGVGILAHSGWALFVDCDVVFMRSPRVIFDLRDPSKAVQVVKHPPMQTSGTKMDGQVQTSYSRKLWSSVMLWNLEHQANRRLTLDMLNCWPGRDLHALKWLADEEIGDLPREANWLVGMQPKPEYPIIAHFTLGTPDMPGLEFSEHAEIWKEVSEK